jgi:hypothetical protein
MGRDGDGMGGDGGRGRTSREVSSSQMCASSSSSACHTKKAPRRAWRESARGTAPHRSRATAAAAAMVARRWSCEGHNRRPHDGHGRGVAAAAAERERGRGGERGWGERERGRRREVE